jgi:hypothetical protein
MIDDVVAPYVAVRPRGLRHRRTGTSTSCGPALKTLYPVGVTIEEIDEQSGGTSTRVPQGRS